MSGAWLNAEREELERKCFKAGLGKRNTEMCVDLFVDRLDVQTIAEKYTLEIYTIYKYKVQFKKKLSRI